MTSAASTLVESMKDDVDAWLRGKDLDLETKYATAIASVGAVPLMVEVFGRFGDATLSGWLTCLIFVWKDLPYQAWKKILYKISAQSPAVYQFIWFACEYLGIDVVRVIQEDSNIDPIARALVKVEFAQGGPPAGSVWVREQLEDRGVAQDLLWRRLAAEGAPMKPGI